MLDQAFNTSSSLKSQDAGPSKFLFLPGSNGLHPAQSDSPDCLKPLAQNVYQEIQSLISKKDYPCMPALASFHQKEYMVGIYRGFSSGLDSKYLVQDLLYFRSIQQQTKSLYMSFWSIFPMDAISDENEFETQMWKQLSYLSTIGNQDSKWDPHFSSDPNSSNFCFSLNGDALFVVGVHPNSSRPARRFPFTTLVFNYYDQFTELDKLGKYKKIVQVNRDRDLKFSGSLNPMVEKYGDHQEAIQFSGKDNPSNWKCPFHHGLKPNTQE